MKKSKQFLDGKNGNSVIGNLFPYDIIFNEGVHEYSDHYIIHMVLWKDLSDEQEEAFISLIHKTMGKNLISVDILESKSEYKFKLKYDQIAESN